MPGWRHLALDVVDSTNVQALALARNGDRGNLWVTASQQTSGRGRRGRPWVSDTGNLFASLLLIDPARGRDLATLPLVVSLALYEAVNTVAGHLTHRLRIKWPNDLLLDGKKLSGILLEASHLDDGRTAVVIGCGVNCAHHPKKNQLYETTSLAAAGVDINPSALFQALACTMAAQLRVWSGGRGFAIIRKDWLERVAGIGEPIVAKLQDEEVRGTFVDIDSSGILLLRLESGGMREISAADIFFASTGSLGA